MVPMLASCSHLSESEHLGMLVSGGGAFTLLARLNTGLNNRVTSPRTIDKGWRTYTIIFAGRRPICDSFADGPKLNVSKPIHSFATWVSA